ncbi:zinc transporter ZIP3 isoform X3 [Ceratina calcarata]|uniref:Zinc transporter ZIP3 isoform X3 n=1 Tax=Ceratina calcarata TaxID=156304 RepID=A0AAJ7S9A3_9HYME|nr:zinc transporter ZIP3 isoform X3 [Ceratina calcarata]
MKLFPEYLNLALYRCLSGEVILQYSDEFTNQINQIYFLGRESEGTGTRDREAGESFAYLFSRLTLSNVRQISVTCPDECSWQCQPTVTPNQCASSIVVSGKMMITVVQAKLASMIIIGVGSFVVGLAPACFVSRVRYLQQRLFLSCTLCFGAGVLLATSILHMLPETRESMPKYAELLFASGFLLLYLIDEIVHYFWNSDYQHQPNRSAANGNNQSEWNQSHNVSYAGSSRTVRVDVNSETPYPTSLMSGNGKGNNWNSTGYGAVQYAPSAPIGFNSEETFLCHGNHSEPCPDSNASLMGLLLALTVHAVLEGLAVGLQKYTSEVFLLVGAVASHKFVVGFCLGLELAGANSVFFKILLATLVFSGGSVIGIGIGMITFRMTNQWTEVVVPILQGLAGGTLLYVTVSEILPRERARWHRSPRRVAGILQLLSVVVGFVIIFLLNKYVTES